MRYEFASDVFDNLMTAPDTYETDCGEEYFPDDRIDQRPSDVVQSKLLKILPRGMAVPVSSMHNCRSVRR